MSNIINHLALMTRLLGNPIAIDALHAQVVRNEQQRIDYHALGEVLNVYGFENKLSKRALSDIPSLAMPVLIILHNEESAVIQKIEGVGNERQYYLCQDDELLQVISHQELQQKYLGYCWFMKPKVSVDTRSELPEYHMPKAWFWKVIGRFKGYYYQVILATFIINILALVSSLYVMNVYDRVIPNRTYETLWVLSIGVILAIVFEFIAKLIRGHLTDIAGKKADLIISSALFRRVLALRLIEKPASSGSYANNLRDFEAVREFMTSASLLVLVDLPFLVLFIVVIANLAGALAIVPLVSIPLVLLVGLAIQPRIARYLNSSVREASQRQGLAVEAIAGVETLKANNATSWAQQRWDYFTAQISATQIKVKDLSNFLIHFATAVQQLNTVALVIVGTYLIHSEDEASRITMGALIAAVILSGRALAPLAQIASLATRFQQALLAFQGVQKIVERPIEHQPERNYIRLEQVQGHLSFKNVAFQYGETNPILSELNVEIKAGEKVGILGRVGSGKSTLLKLTAGLYDVAQGHICLDHVDIRQLDPHFLRSQIALFSQAPQLFLGTLRENLAMAMPAGQVQDQAMLHALRQVGLLAFVQNHPKGLDMPLGEQGLGLSGGQKQLLAFARLLLKDPKVVLLDEPTNHLDPALEEAMLHAVAHWAKSRTLLMVTHRPQNLKIVDRIIVIDQGKVVMDGARDAVLARLQGQPSTPQKI